MTHRPCASLCSGPNHRSSDPATCPAYSRDVLMGAGGGRAWIRSNRTRTCPVTPPPDKPSRGGVLLSSPAQGTSHSTRDAEVASNNDLLPDMSGRHFLFDTKCVILGRNRTVIPSQPRHFHAHRPGNLRPFALSKELSHSHTGRPFTLGTELHTSPLVLSPAALVLNNRNSFSIESCKLSRPKVNYPPTCHLQAVKDNQRIQPFSDPMIGAPRSFIHRISELSSLEGETVRQEKLKKIKKHTELHKPSSFQWLVLMACLSSGVFVGCLTWLLSTLWSV